MSHLHLVKKPIPLCTEEEAEIARRERDEERREAERKANIRITEGGYVLSPWGLAENLEDGLAMGNCIVAACYGPRGEKR